MVVALTLLLAALFAVLYHDRDFWFPDTLEAEDESQPVAPASAAPTTQAGKQELAIRKKSHRTKPEPNPSALPGSSNRPLTVTATRTVLPPLEVEVVAGDEHQTIRPNTDAVKIELQPESAPQEAGNTPWSATETAAGVTSNAAERVEMPTDTSDVISRSVKPGYPLLARQMKVQGSVILLAMIGRDGLIQDLRVLSGPPILAAAAREAVRQWHFKPHYEGADAVETVAKVTVNFTISTN